MKRIVVFALIVMGSLAVVTPTQAGPIVDTGAGFGNNYTLTGAALGEGSYQWLAAEFVTSQAWVITSLEGWISTGLGGDVTFAVYDDGGKVPGVELFSQSLTLPDGAPGAVAWFGPSGLSWLLPEAGSYWAVFEVRTGSSFWGAMPGASPSPLMDEAFYHSAAGIYMAVDTLDLGVRINANGPEPTAAVPEPASILLIGTGLAGLTAKARRRKK